MLILTIQKKEVYDKLIKGEYKVDFWKSPYAFLNTRFTKEYRRLGNILNAINRKEAFSESAYFWGWSQNPYLDFFKNSEDYVAIFMEISSKKMVFSRYDLYTSYCLEESENRDYLVNEGITDSNECIQCVFSGFNLKSIKLVTDLSMLKGMTGSVSSMYISVMLMYQWLFLSKLSRGYSLLKG